MSPPDVLSLDAILDRFEQAWQEHPPADLSVYLLPPVHANRRELLVDLIHIDLEYRWKAGAGPRVEDYLTRYQEIAADVEVVARLAAWEFQLRQRTGREEPVDRFVERFPDQAEQLTASITRISHVPPLPDGGADQPTSHPRLPGYQELKEVKRDG